MESNLERFLSGTMKWKKTWDIICKVISEPYGDRGVNFLTWEGLCIVLYCIVYLYSAQYLHILQDSKRYLTNRTVQVQPQLTSN